MHVAPDFISPSACGWSAARPTARPPHEYAPPRPRANVRLARSSHHGVTTVRAGLSSPTRPQAERPATCTGASEAVDRGRYSAHLDSSSPPASRRADVARCSGCVGHARSECKARRMTARFGCGRKLCRRIRPPRTGSLRVAQQKRGDATASPSWPIPSHLSHRRHSRSARQPLLSAFAIEFHTIGRWRVVAVAGIATRQEHGVLA